ncbi:hypothetical protein Plo01_65730 [Planobispora longispora]|uniref:Uncharacterized protein n=1 Tax=Planobispora longispora TaxID=28887 RepID=A0A8J3RS09_9ACTN|nr:hypothetical protein Plo01_65730 [Planobispora longispora]
MLDGSPTDTVWMVPVRGRAGEILDFEARAASSCARDIRGRAGRQLIGTRPFSAYPSIVAGPLHGLYLRVMETGEPGEIVRYPYTEASEGVPRHSVYTVKVARVFGGLLVSWIRNDEDDRLAMRLAQTERLGNLGWGRWNLVTGDIEWSEQLYRIHGRDPADGPIDLERYREIAHPDDLTVIDRAVEAMNTVETPYEYEIRVRVGDDYRLLRNVAEISRDGTGRPIEVHGLIQDITDWRRTADQLAAAEQRLVEESRLTAELQHIVLPVQEEFLTLPGLRVAVRYDAAATAPLGGDWYQAIGLNDDEALLAVGDVAGSGLAAASAMAKLRHAITGLAFADQTPEQILVTLNRLLRRMRPDVLATALVARFRAQDRRLTFTHAGHPPMLLVRDGVVHRLLQPGVLLGVFDDVDYVGASVQLEPNDLLVMFTDGLIERPGRDLFEGLDILSATITAVLRTAPADQLAAVTNALAPSNTSDDTCILVAHLSSIVPEVS